VREHKGLKVAFIPEAVCYTEVPESWRDLYKQRIRWQKAFVDCAMLYYRSFLTTMFTNPVSFFLIFDAALVGVVGTYMWVIALAAMLFHHPLADWHVMAMYGSLTMSVNTLYSIVSITLARRYGHKLQKDDALPMMITLLLDLVLFRFISIIYITFGCVLYFFNRHGWNKVSRTGRNYSAEMGQKNTAA
jgi:cellulose synthase/poly-beta-1,6-N-acetylglucosamine synthase-like glycosyltransferase